MLSARAASPKRRARSPTTSRAKSLKTSGPPGQRAQRARGPAYAPSPVAAMPLVLPNRQAPSRSDRPTNTLSAACPDGCRCAAIEDVPWRDGYRSLRRSQVHEILASWTTKIGQHRQGSESSRELFRLAGRWPTANAVHCISWPLSRRTGRRDRRSTSTRPGRAALRRSIPTFGR